MWSGPAGRGCQNGGGYGPDTAYRDHVPGKYIRVNVHIMPGGDSSRTFKQDSAPVFY